MSGDIDGICFPDIEVVLFPSPKLSLGNRGQLQIDRLTLAYLRQLSLLL